MKRSRRHRLVGSVLRLRAVAYVVVGAPVLFASSNAFLVVLPGIALLILAAGAPFVARRSNRYTGVRLSAFVDLVVSYALWLIVPWSGAISLLLALWAIALVVFFGPPESASRITLFAVVLELSKMGAVAAGVVSPNVAAPSITTDIGILFARTIALNGAYLLFRGIDHYVLQLAAAAETGSERYRRLMDAAPTGYLVQADDAIVYANQAAEEALDQPRAGLIGRSFASLITAADGERAREAVQSASDRFEPVKLKDVRIGQESSSQSWVDVTCSVIDYGQDLAVQIALHDRSEQRKAEIDLARTRVDYRQFFERIPVALYRSLPSGQITDANAALVDLLGATSEEEVTALDAHDLYVNKSDREHLVEMLEVDDVVVGFETRMRRLDGRTIWIRDTSRRIESARGVAYEGAMVDITGTRAIEDELWSRAAQQEAAATIGQIALDSDDIAGVLDEITALMSRVLGTESVVLLQRAPDGEFDLTGADSGLTVTPGSLETVADRAHMTAAPVVLSSDTEVRFTAPDLADLGVSACAAVMVPGVNSAFGTLVVLDGQPRLFTADDINFLLAVSNVLAAAIDRSTARARLEDLLRSKDAFVASVSHELRTPLTVVTGMAHELNEHWMNLSDEELGEFTEMLVDQSRDMSDLIEDLLVAARSNIGNVTVRREHVDLEREIEVVVAGFSDTGSSSIEVTTSKGTVVADPIRVRQILRNLITNALRYGGPNIEVVATATSGSMAVEVIDDGEGIPAEDHDRIFLAYERAHAAAGQPGSVGLGLTVSRTLADLMGGSLTYRFEEQSVFRLELPRVASDPADLADADLSHTLGAIGAGRIGVDVGPIG